MDWLTKNRLNKQTITLTLKTIELLHIGNLSEKRLPRAATLPELDRVGQHNVEIDRAGQHNVELHRAGQHNVEIDRVGQHNVEIDRVGQHNVEIDRWDSTM